MNIIRDNEELAYRILAGDNLINIEIATSISNNKINKSNVYIDLCHQSGIPPEITTLSNWMNTILEKIRNVIIRKINKDIREKEQSKSSSEEIPQYFHFNSFSLTETLKTGTITYDYYMHNKEIKHTEQVKISKVLYKILDSLTLFIPEEFIPSDSNNNDSNNVDYDIIISNSPDNKHTHMLLTVHPATEQYEIVNKIDLVSMTSKSNKSNQQDQQSENINIVVIPASEHRSLIDQSKIAMTNKYLINELDKSLYIRDRITDDIVIYELETQNKQQDEETLWSKPWYIFKNIQWLHYDFESKYSYLGTKSKDYFFDTATGYQVIPDWSLTGRIGGSKGKFFLLHEQSVNKDIKDIWVYYESPSSSSSKTKSFYEIKSYGYDEKTVKTYNNLEDALNDLETKINHPCHKSGMRIKSLYLLSKKQTVDDKEETLEKHNIKIEA